MGCIAYLPIDIRRLHRKNVKGTLILYKKRSAAQSSERAKQIDTAPFSFYNVRLAYESDFRQQKGDATWRRRTISILS